MKNVLIFPCGTEIGLEIHRALKDSIHFNIYGANSCDDHGKFVYKNYIPDVPFFNEDNFISVLNDIIEKYAIDYIIPAHDSALIELIENQKRLGAIVVTSNVETCRICRSKKLTYDLLCSLIKTPKVYIRSEDKNYPVFLKPDKGQGSKGTYVATNDEELEFYLKKYPELLILEYLPGSEYTIDCFTTKTGELVFSEGRSRSRISNGISVNSKRVKDPRFIEIAKKINSKISFQGAWFFQLKKRQNGELVLLEVASRIAGTMCLFRTSGINFAQLSLFDKMGLDVDLLFNDFEIEVDRSLTQKFTIKQKYSTIYIDFDDTIIVNETVNVNAIKFLYNSKNNKKRIILISKHKKDIKDTLIEFSLSDKLFDEIIILKENEEKVDFITDKNSIFIDDSFAERKNVFDKLRIPVFSVDTIDALITSND